MLLLSESEDAYIHFIKRNQKVELQELKLKVEETFVEKCLKCMRNSQQSDRLLFDKANRAVVSYIQAYQKHECYLILKLKDLDLGKVFMGFGLLKIPKMPEVKGRDLSSFQEVDVDINLISYKDKKRESMRKTKLEEYKNTGVWPGKDKKRMKNTEPWSEAKKNNLEKKGKKKIRKEKQRKRDENNPEKKKRKRKNISEEDLQELANDMALIKKFKKKKVSN